MNLPQILIEFKSKAQSIIQRSERGVVAVILKDNTAGAIPFSIYKSLSDVEFEKMSEKNYRYLKLIFDGAPYKVMVAVIPEEDNSYSKALKVLENYKWNYLVVPSANEESTPVISSWIKEQRTNNKKTFKAVLANHAADCEGIINFTTGNIVSTITGNEVKLTAAEYCARIAGIVAGLSLSRSLTYYVLTDIISADIPSNPEELVNKGELVVLFDGEKYKIARGINSYTSGNNEDLKKIKVIESKDTVYQDIKTTFEEKYVGKVINDYDNKQNLVAAIVTYFKSMEGDVLDRTYNNSCAISLEDQRSYLLSQGEDTEAMSDIEILQANTGSMVFLTAAIKFVDAMEDLKMEINM